MYLNFRNSGRCGSVVVRDRDYDTKRTGSTLGFDLLSFYPVIETLSITGQNFSNGAFLWDNHDQDQ